MRSALLRRVVVAAILSLFLIGSPAQSFKESGSFEHNRSRLLAFMFLDDMSKLHFSHKNVDDDLSKAAFSLYLKQLDPQKRFLLKKDAEKLQRFSNRIDDELRSADLTLPDAAASVISNRVKRVSKVVSEILSSDFDFKVEETVETDVEKLDYCKTEDELRERWRKNLKLQVLNRYLNLLDDERSKPDRPGELKENNPEEERRLQKKAREKILKNYELVFSRLVKEPEREHYDRYFSAVARAFDPHSDYMPPINREDFDISMKGSLEGIGASLREEDGYIKVVSLVPGGPAYREGRLHAEDIILKVGEGRDEPVDITDMKVTDAVRLIRGKKGTEVRLTVRKPDGEQVTIPIVRDIVQLEETFAKGTVLKDGKSLHPFGYVKIPAFYRDFEGTRHGGKGRNSTDDVRKEIERLRSHNVEGLIIDLRNNGGGALVDAVNIAGLFIKSGPVVQVKDSDNRVSVLSDDDPAMSFDGPVVILVNTFSASASEILAAAMQDYGRAVIIGGEHTHGKGTVQSIIDLDNNIPFQNMGKFKPFGALRLTIQKFYRVSGGSTQYRGVIPDITLPDRMKGLKSGEKYLEYALPWDTISPAPYSKWSGKAIDIQGLRDRSLSRTRVSQEFVDIDKASIKFQERQKKTTYSLNIDEVRKEREEAKSMKGTDDGDVSEHSRKGKKPDTSVMTEEERHAAWVKDLSEDVYVRESLAVLEDMISTADVHNASR